MLQTSQPLFSNDLAGAVKAGIAFGGTLLVLSGVIVKWGQGRFQKELEMAEEAQKKTADDLTALGKKVDDLDKGCIEETARTGEMRSRLDRQDLILQGVLTQQGEFKAGITALHAQSVELQRDMTTLITESGRQVNTSIQSLALDLARLEAAAKERDRMSEVIDRFMRAARGDGGERK